MKEALEQGAPTDRHAAVFKHLENNKVEQAIMALLDYTRDLGLLRAYQRDIVLCANNLRALDEGERRFGATEGTRRQRNELLDRFMRLADAVEEEAKKRSLGLPSKHPPPPISPSAAPTNAGTNNLESVRRSFLENRRHALVPIVSTPRQPLCVCSNISRTLTSGALTFQLSGVSLSLYSQEITGLVGLNGSGKSTVLRIIAGELAIDDGEISYPALADGLAWNEIKSQIAYVPQQLPAWSSSIEDNLACHASLRGITGRENEDEVDFILYRLGLDGFRKAKWQQLSGGIQMRCALARALVWRPRLLILDEPLAPLDVETQQLFLRDIWDLSRSHKAPISVIISSQHLHEIEAFSDHMLVLAHGTPSFYGSPKEMGAERAINIFEITCSASQDQLSAILSMLSIEQVKHVGRQHVIHAPRNVSGNEILRALLDHPSIQIESFRDLSRSSRQLLHHEDRL